MGMNGEALQLHAVYKKLYFLLQVKRKHVSASEHAMKSKKIKKNHYHHSTKLY